MSGDESMETSEIERRREKDRSRVAQTINLFRDGDVQVRTVQYDSIVELLCETCFLFVFYFCSMAVSIQ